MLDLAPSFKLARLLRFHIWNKRPPPHPRKNEVQYSVRYMRHIRYFNECDIRNITKLMFFTGRTGLLLISSIEISMLDLLTSRAFKRVARQ